jgi:hypothetical protein
MYDRPSVLKSTVGMQPYKNEHEVSSDDLLTVREVDLDPKAHWMLILVPDAGTTAFKA